NEQQDDEHILELREQPAPCGHRCVGLQLVAAVHSKPRPRLVAAETATRIGSEHRDDLVDVLTVRAVSVRRIAGRGEPGRHTDRMVTRSPGALAPAVFGSVETARGCGGSAITGV